MTDGQARQLIGWREYVDLPQWGITGLKAKVDTGARTSAIDVADIEPVGEDKVRFHVVLHRHERQLRQAVEAVLVRRSKVRSSLGEHGSRLVVETLIRLGEYERRIELSLVCRKNLICRMLLGRSALAGQFAVDPDRTYLLTKETSPD